MGTKNPLVFARPLRRNELTLWTTRAAHSHRKSGPELVVVDEFPPSLRSADAVFARARRLIEVRHPNLAAVRDAAKADGARIVVSEFVEGERLDELAQRERPSIDIALRIVIDVLGALSALHELDDPIVHGHVASHNVIVGVDGSSRLIRGYLGPGHFVVIKPGSAKLAPEIREDGVVDARADLFAVGALLDELLPPPDERPRWAAPLAEIVAKACANQVRKRYDCAADFARAVRLLVRSRLASPARVAAFVQSTVGDRIAARRAELGDPGPRRLQPSMLEAAAASATLPVTRTQPMPRAKIPSSPPAPRRGPSTRRKKTPPAALLVPLAGKREPSAAYEIPTEGARFWMVALAIVILLAGGVGWWVHSRSPKVSAIASTATTTEAEGVSVSPPVRAAELPTTTPTARTNRSLTPSAPPASSSATRRPFDPSAIF